MKYGDDIVWDKTPEVIEGHCKLELIPGDLYEIHYGIHQGKYVYEGKVSKDDPNHIYSRGQHMFRKVETGELTFGYYGHTSPYEFTSIVRHINKQGERI